MARAGIDLGHNARGGRARTMWKNVVILIATVLAFGVSLAMLWQVIGIASPWMACMVMLCFLGLAKMAEPLYALRVPAGLRSIRPWEWRGGPYERLAVPRFGALLRDTPLRLLNTAVYLSRGRRDPPAIARLVESAEASHFYAALLLVPWMACYAWTGRWAAFAGLLLVQVVGNAYPIMHLRSVRGRLERIGRRARGAAA